LLYILEGVEVTSKQTIKLIIEINNLMLDYKHRIRSDLPKIYSQELINNLFNHPYTKIEYLRHDLNVTRLTASKYLDCLDKSGFVKKEKLGRYNYYINEPVQLLTHSFNFFLHYFPIQKVVIFFNSIH
jgi:predicted transcriptional regulator